MKIVCIIGSSKPHLTYFVNRIDEVHDVSFVILENKKIPMKKRLKTKLDKDGLIAFPHYLRDKMVRRLKKRKYIMDYNRHFSNKWKKLNERIPYTTVNKINDISVLKRLKSIKPEIILVHGTSLIKDEIINTAKHNLNLHYGLSPYYRGIKSVETALLLADPLNIGVTIHKLTKIVDGGAILAQERAVIQPDDTANSIRMQLTKIGTEIIIKAIEKLKSGKELKYKKQDFSKGYGIWTYQWNRYLTKAIEEIESKNLIKKIMKKPSRVQKLPIINMLNS